MSEQPREPYLLRPGEGDAVWAFGNRFTTKMSGAVTGDRLTMVEAEATKSAEPPIHVHEREDEAWYIVDGQMTFRVGDQEHVATTGSFVFAPRGIPHTFLVDVEPTRVLVIVSPAGFERFIEEIGVPAEGDTLPDGAPIPSPEEIMGVGERFGIRVVGPPPRLS